MRRSYFQNQTELHVGCRARYKVGVMKLSAALVPFVLMVFGLFAHHTGEAIAAELKANEEISFELGAMTASVTYERPKGADYFWWDADSQVQVELTFDDGSIKILSSEETFTKKIVKVKFLNPTTVMQKIVLRTGR